MSEATTTSDSSAASKKCSPWLLLAMPVAVGIALGMVITLVQSLREVDTRSIYLGLDGMRLPIGVAMFTLILATVATVVFRPKLKTLALSGIALLLTAIALFSTVRVESFYGNMMPRLAWRWTPTAEQQVTMFLTNTAKVPSRTLEISQFYQTTSHDFPQFLGPHRDGVLAGVKLSSDWNSNPPQVLWRHPVGLGWSSFAVVGRAAVTLEQRGPSECVVCYDVKTGEEIWSHGEVTRFTDEHGDGPRTTPTIFGDRVLSMGANGLLTCLQLETGKLLWKRSTLDNPDHQNLLWGMSGSPLICGEQVVVTPGSGDGAAARAYYISDGEEAWHNGNDRAAYASPIEADICGDRQILSFNGAGLRAYAIDGTPLWLHPWLTQGESQRVNVAQPVVLEQTSAESLKDTAHLRSQVLISSGYDNGTALLEICRADNSWKVEEVWTSKQLKSKMSNFVVRDGFLYGLDNGILTCVDLKDGQRKWKRGRYGHGQMLLVDDKLLIQAETGEIVLVAASPTSHQELAKFNALFSKTWNNLALAGNIMVVRNDREAAAFELPIEDHE
jgi:outer membrane protein assembly factor BamB